MLRDFLKKLMAICILITLLGVDIVLLSKQFYTYAIEDTGTNSANVEFKAYMLDSQNKKTENLTTSIDAEDLKLFVEIGVKQEGYFDGGFKLSNSNFKIVDVSQNDKVNNIGDNEISLNRINAGESVIIELSIEIIKQDSIDSDFINKESVIDLEGTYTNSKETEAVITGNRKVKIGLTVPETEESIVNLSSEILTNKIYNIENENKRMVQLLIKSGLNNNIYPIKQTNLQLDVPAEVEKVSVISNDTNATNGKDFTNFTDENWEWKENKLNITVNNNEENGKISWKQNGNDEFIVTYIMPEETDFQDFSITIKSFITLYDNNSTILTNETKSELDEEKDGTVTYTILNEEESIYKGKIYSNEKREYKTTRILNINDVELVNNIKISEQEDTYQNENGSTSTSANAIYKNIILDKNNINYVLGNDGKITISTPLGEVIKEINSKTEADENGKIVINCEEKEVKGLEIKIENAQKDGKIYFSYSKILMGTNLSRKQINTLNEIEETALVETELNREEIKNNITLLESKSSATIDVNKTSLSTTKDNTDVEIRVVLENNKEEYNLFKNPEILISFPEEVTDVEVTSSEFLYANGLEKKEYGLKTVDGKKAICISLNGEQMEHQEGDIIKGTVFIIKANIKLDKKAVSSDSSIKMAYSNEYTGEKEIFTTEKAIKIVAPDDLILASSIENAGIVTTNENPRLVAYVGREELSNNSEIAQGEVIKYRIEVKNEGTEDEQEVTIKGLVPEGTTYVFFNTEQNTELLGNNYYYEDESKKEVTFTETIKSGETLVKEYEVRVNKDTAVDTSISNIVTITKNGEEQQTRESILKVKKADMRVLLGSNTPYDAEIRVNNIFKYCIRIENWTQEDLNNLTINMLLPENTEITYLLALSKSIDEYTESVENVKTFEKLEAGDVLNIEVGLKITDIANYQEDFTISVNAKADNTDIYRSNTVVRKVTKMDGEILVEASSENEIVKYNDEITYSIEIKNKSFSSDFQFDVECPENFKIQSILYNDQDLKEVYGEISNTNSTDIDVSLGENETANIQIKVKVGTLISENEINSAVTKFTLSDLSNVVDTKEIIHLLKADIITKTEEPEEPDTPDNPDIPDTPDTPDTPDNPDTPSESEKYSLTGVAWVDKDKNGEKNTSESGISGINVYLLDKNTNEFVKNSNGEPLKVQTDSNGIYVFNDIEKGKYIVIFEFDSSKYGVTKYMSENVSENLNSNAILDEISINGQSKKVGMTDIIEISNHDITGINIGFIELKEFNFKLDKYVSKIIVQTSNSTEVREYNNTTMAKIEIDGKRINGATIQIEYSIKVTNCGEVGGYIKSILDYLPEGLEFDKSLNSGWEKENSKLYNTSLANVEISAGESKTVSLIVTKKLDEDNFGLINNLAEIGESYNEQEIPDSNSIAGNRELKEDDIGSANVIVSIKTGKVILYISMALAVLGIVIIGVYFIKKKVLDVKN